MATIAQLLEEEDSPTDLTMLAVSCSAFTICPECGHVDDKQETLMNHPCQTCGTNVCCRRLLFSDEVRLLEMIFECYKTKKSNELCVLLFCALMEQHLAELLKSRCLRVNIQWQVGELLLEGFERVDDRLKLFRRLTGTKIQDALAGMPVVSVFETYLDLRKKRNGIAHGLAGASYSISKQDIADAVNAAADSFSCFAHLHHTSCAVDSPGLPPG